MATAQPPPQRTASALGQTSMSPRPSISPLGHAQRPSFSSHHSHTQSFSSAHSWLPGMPGGPSTAQSQGHTHGHTPSYSSAHSPSMPPPPSPRPQHTASLSLGSPSFGHAPLASCTAGKRAPSSHGHGAAPHMPPSSPVMAAKAAMREAEENGAPTTGMYAQNGLWDDDSDDNSNNDKSTMSWRSRLSGSTASAANGDRRSVKSSKSAKTTGSNGSRSRSNTLTAPAPGFGPSPTADSTPWPWGRKATANAAAVSASASASTSTPAAPPMSATPVFPNAVPVPSPSASVADGLNVRASASASGQQPSPLSPGLTSPTLLGSIAPSSYPSPAAVPVLKQRTSRLRLRSKTAKQNEPPKSTAEKPGIAVRPPLQPVGSDSNVPAPAPVASKATPTAGADGKPKSAWKRGMERLWRSRSAGNMRDQYRQSEAENLPPVPALPLQHALENARARLTSQPNPPGGLAPLATSPLSPPPMLSPALSSPDAENSIFAQLDQKYPSYRPLRPSGPALRDADEMEADPFASAIDYSERSRRPSSRAPLSPTATDFAPPNILVEGERPSSPRHSPSLNNLRQAFVPRLRKSRSVNLTRRPSSILSALRGEGRMSRAMSPPARPQTPEQQPKLNELAQLAMGASPLAPPRPLFYDSFGLEGEDDDEENGSTHPVVLNHLQLQSVEELPSPVPSLATSRQTHASSSGDASPRPRKVSVSQGPPLSLDTTEAVSCPNPVTAKAPSTTPTTPFPASTPATTRATSSLGHGSADVKADTGSSEIDTFARTPLDSSRSHTPAHDQSRAETCVSPFDAPAWAATIAAFPTIDDPILGATSLDFDIAALGTRESLTSSVGDAPVDSPTTMTQHGVSDHRQSTQMPSTSSAGHSASQRASTAKWTALPRLDARPDARRGGGSRGSSRDSSRERRTRTASGAWSELDSDSSDESEDEDDDVALGMVHPEAAAAQQQRLADQKRRRAARRAARAAKIQAEMATSDQLRRSRTSVGSTASRKWNGEGVAPDALAGHLERAVALSKQGGSAPPRPVRRDHASPLEPASASLSRATTLGRSSTQSARSGGSRGVSDAARVPSDGTEPRPGSRSTTNSGSPASTVGRRRSQSTSRQLPPATTPNEPTPVRHGTAVRCVVEPRSGKQSPMQLEAYPETTARDVLLQARSSGAIPEGGHWVVCESFGELSLDRQVREHEVVLSGVTRGWDASSSGNKLVVRELQHPHNNWTRTIPETAPWASGWVQTETKPGKWTKRWAEARGGQVFLSKNEKGKDETHVSTLFSDVYLADRGVVGAPQQYVLALKRLDAAASFQNPAEYITYISTDDSTGWKLHGAMFLSRSFALAQADPSVRQRAAVSERAALSSGSGSGSAPASATTPASGSGSLPPPHHQPTRKMSAPLASTSSRVHAHGYGHVHASAPQAPHAAAMQPPAVHAHSHAHTHAHAAHPARTSAGARPLVDLHGDPSGFTGRGLLRRK